MVKPSCLVIGEVGRCRPDGEYANLLFDAVDRRYEKEGPNTLILASNTPTNQWGDFFTDDGAVVRLGQAVRLGSIFMMKGPSCRGRGCEVFSVEAAASVTKGTR